jgi:hypothetical protein
MLNTQNKIFNVIHIRFKMYVNQILLLLKTIRYFLNILFGYSIRYHRVTLNVSGFENDLDAAKVVLVELLLCFSL